MCDFVPEHSRKFVIILNNVKQPGVNNDLEAGVIEMRSGKILEMIQIIKNKRNPII